MYYQAKSTAAYYPFQQRKMKSIHLKISNCLPMITPPMSLSKTATHKENVAFYLEHSHRIKYCYHHS